VVYVGVDNIIYALDAGSGTELWRFPTGSYVVAGPTVANGVVYVGSMDYNVYAFDLAGGQQIKKPRASAQRPDPATLHPDFDLKPSQPVAKLPDGD
jgi:outer membrane protein assembly factor BamB